ncbi:enoyl-CoA hydratase/isomerase family protein [Spirillospora sp. NPDC029432]|uniref:enoyl-CoA hydratase/isomerase family protein n=1 Tax=Spirillospora sp. NPDC029432 TaxID=3154599 RepID=UPI003455DE6E
MDLLRTSLPELADALDLGDAPLAAVELDDASPAVLERIATRARDADRILIGLGDGPPEAADLLDLTLGNAGSASIPVDDPETELAALADAVRRNPQASLVLAQVLRASEHLPVPAALDVESLAYSTLLGGPEFARWLDERGPRPLPPDAEHPVLAERDGDLLHVTLNRPERRNAYGRQLRDALVEALTIAVHAPDVRVLLDGAGPAFCSGGDLAEFGTTPDLVSAHLIRTRGGAGRLVHALRDRIEVRLHGACVGAGLELPAFAGTVRAASDTVFRLPEIAMGLIPGAGGTVSLPRRIGRHRTLYLALTGRPMDAATAREWGMVDA